MRDHFFLPCTLKMHSVCRRQNDVGGLSVGKREIVTIPLAVFFGPSVSASKLFSREGEVLPGHVWSQYPLRCSGTVISFYICVTVSALRCCITSRKIRVELLLDGSQRWCTTSRKICAELLLDG